MQPVKNSLKIVSLLPAATELVAALGLAKQLVGVSHVCDYPPCVRGLPQLTQLTLDTNLSSSQIDAEVRQRLQAGGSFYMLDAAGLAALAPDLILTQGLCEVCAVDEVEVRQLAAKLPQPAQLVSLNPRCLADVFDNLQQVAAATGAVDAAQRLAATWQQRINAVTQRVQAAHKPPRVLLLEWLEPPFSAGHWNPELIQLAGGHSLHTLAGEPSQTLTWPELVSQAPEVVIISCCGQELPRIVHDFRQLALPQAWTTLPAVQSGRVWAVDGSHYFNRPGPRLIESLEILAHLLHPQLVPYSAAGPAPFCQLTAEL